MRKRPAFPSSSSSIRGNRARPVGQAADSATPGTSDRHLCRAAALQGVRHKKCPSPFPGPSSPSPVPGRGPQLGAAELGAETAPRPVGSERSGKGFWECRYGGASVCRPGYCAARPRNPGFTSTELAARGLRNLVAWPRVRPFGLFLNPRVTRNARYGAEIFSPSLPIVSFIGTHPISSHQHASPPIPRLRVHTKEPSPQMSTQMAQVRNLEDLRDYVNEIFCDQYQLQVGAFEMTEKVLRRGGKPCGIYFCLHGPRAVKFSAIWETERNRVLFYSSTGERFCKTQLLEAPALERAAA